MYQKHFSEAYRILYEKLSSVRQMVRIVTKKGKYEDVPNRYNKVSTILKGGSMTGMR